MNDEYRTRAAFEIRDSPAHPYRTLAVGPSSLQEKWLASILESADAMAGARWADDAVSGALRTQLQRLVRVLSGVPELRTLSRQDLRIGRCARWLFPADVIGTDGASPDGVYVTLAPQLVDDQHNSVESHFRSIVTELRIRP